MKRNLPKEIYEKGCQENHFNLLFWIDIFSDWNKSSFTYKLILIIENIIIIKTLYVISNDLIFEILLRNEILKIVLVILLGFYITQRQF